jgi:hypothetical protein
MSETSPTESSTATDATESLAEPSPESDAAEPSPESDAAEPSPESGGKSPAPASRTSKLSHWATLAALPIAVIAKPVAAVGWFYPHKSTSSSSTPTYTDQQTKDAKAHLCAAFITVDRAVVRNTHMKNPSDGGPIGALAVATSARLALSAGGAYLQDRVTLEPAAPADLAKAVGSVGAILQELGMNYLASAPEFAQDTLRQNLDAGIKTVADRCK